MAAINLFVVNYQTNNLPDCGAVLAEVEKRITYVCVCVFVQVGSIFVCYVYVRLALLLNLFLSPRPNH